MGKTPLTILYILGATIALLIFTFFGLGWYTNHGDFVVVPDIKGKGIKRLRFGLHYFRFNI